MKIATIFLMTMLSLGLTWMGDFDAAKKEATEKHRFILINFSGSDWCVPCIRLRKEILESSVFETYATGHLILVRADFPRQKKNMPDKEQLKRNEALADKYNPNGKFPYTVLVDGTGKVIRGWDGFPDESPNQFVSDIDYYYSSH